MSIAAKFRQQGLVGLFIKGFVLILGFLGRLRFWRVLLLLLRPIFASNQVYHCHASASEVLKQLPYNFILKLEKDMQSVSLH